MAAVVTQLASAFEARDAVLACHTFSKGLKEQLAKVAAAQDHALASKGCATQVKPTLAGELAKSGSVVSAHILNARADGDQGVVTYRTADGQAWSLPLVHENDGWKISSASPRSVR